MVSVLSDNRSTDRHVRLGLYQGFMAFITGLFAARETLFNLQCIQDSTLWSLYFGFCGF